MSAPAFEQVWAGGTAWLLRDPHVSRLHGDVFLSGVEVDWEGRQADPDKPAVRVFPIEKVGRRVPLVLRGKGSRSRGLIEATTEEVAA